jgi:hypothetical protein
MALAALWMGLQPGSVIPAALLLSPLGVCLRVELGLILPARGTGTLLANLLGTLISCLALLAWQGAAQVNVCLLLCGMLIFYCAARFAASGLRAADDGLLCGRPVVRSGRSAVDRIRAHARDADHGRARFRAPLARVGCDSPRHRICDYYVSICNVTKQRECVHDAKADTEIDDVVEKFIFFKSHEEKETVGAIKRNPTGIVFFIDY